MGLDRPEWGSNQPGAWPLLPEGSGTTPADTPQARLTGILDCVAPERVVMDDGRVVWGSSLSETSFSGLPWPNRTKVQSI